MEIDESWLSSLLVEEDPSNRDGICKISRFQAEPGVGKNENAGSEIIRVHITALLHSGEEVVKSFIYKKERPGFPPTNEGLDLFQTESNMYCKYLKDMTRLKKEHNETGEATWPICYGFQDDLILFQDLKEEGFRTVLKSQGLNWDHSALAIKELAMFHALSAVLLQKGMVDSNDFRISIFLRDLPMIRNLYKHGISNLADSMLAQWGPDWENTANRLKGIANESGLRLKQLGEETKGDFDVINHGDCWSNNFMFKYKEDSEFPLRMMFIDFQVSHINSYAWDLTYLLYNCLLPDLRREIIDKLLDLYSDTLAELCRKYGFDGQPPSRDDVQKSMDKIMFFGVLNTLCTMPILLASDRADFEFNVDRLVENNTESEETNPYQSFCYTDEKYIDITKRDLEYFTGLNVI